MHTYQLLESLDSSTPPLRRRSGIVCFAVKDKLTAMINAAHCPTGVSNE
jgi:hypothetical protein